MFLKIKFSNSQRPGLFAWKLLLTRFPGWDCHSKLSFTNEEGGTILRNTISEIKGLHKPTWKAWGKRKWKPIASVATSMGKCYQLGSEWVRLGAVVFWEHIKKGRHFWRADQGTKGWVYGLWLSPISVSFFSFMVLWNMYVTSSHMQSFYDGTCKTSCMCHQISISFEMLKILYLCISWEISGH